MQSTDLLERRIFGGGGGGGRGKGGGGGGGESRTPVEDQNTLRSRSFARVLDLLSEGEIGGLVNGAASIYFNETPWYSFDNGAWRSNFEGVHADMRYGTAIQPHMGGFAFTETALATPSGDFVSRYAPLEATITTPESTAALVSLRWQQMSWQNPTNGDLKGMFSDFRIEVKSNFGNFQTAVWKRLSGKTVAGYEETFRIELPAGGAPWTVRVSRESPNDDEAITDDGNPADINGSHAQAFYAVTGVRGDRGGVQRNSKFVWSALVAVTDAKLMYPNSAYVGLQVDAQSFGGQVPRRAYDIYGIKVRVPTNYDPVNRTYTGLWGGSWKEAWTNNPAWVFYDLLSNNRYGLGDLLHRGMDLYGTGSYVSPLESLTKWRLYEIAQYCDGLVPDGRGGWEPRFTMNCVINTRQEAFVLLQTIAAAFRSLAFWAGGSVWPMQDSPKDSSAVITPANVIGGDFTYRTTSQKARHTVALVTWNDPEDFYRPKVEMVEDAEGIQRWGQRPIEIVAFGCTSRAQAVRYGRWLLYTDQYETETVSFSVGLDNLKMLPGDVFDIADPAVAGARLGGRLKGASATNAVELDAPITMLTDPITGVPYTYEIAIVLPSGAVEKRTIGYLPGQVTNITTTLPFSEQPQQNAMWAIVEGDAKTRKFRCVSIRESGKHVFAVDAVLHNPAKWAFIEQNIPLPDESFSRVPTGPIEAPRLPDDLGLEAGEARFLKETLYRANNAVKTRLTLSWQAPRVRQGFESDGITPRFVPDSRVRLYTIEARNPSGVWQTLGETSTPSFEVQDAEPGNWAFRIYARSIASRSPPLVREVLVLGKAAPPATVTGFTASEDVNGAWVTWTPVEDIDLVGYEIRDGQSWDTGVLVITGFKGNSFFLQLTDTLEHTLWIKALDDSGNYSTVPSFTVARVKRPDGVETFEGFAQDDYIKLSWRAVPGIDVTYEIRAGVSWDLGQTIGVTDATTFEALFPNEGNKTFWIKAVSKLGLYSDGTRFVTIVCKNPPYRNIVYSQTQRPSFAGYRSNMRVDNIGPSATGALMVDQFTPIRKYGEYHITVNLGASYTARSWLQADIVAIPSDPTSWADATFSWDSEPSLSPWFQDGNAAGARSVFEIATQIGYTSDLIYHWPLSANLDPARATPGDGLTVLVEGTPTYENGRWGNALRVTETRRFTWAVTVPSEFSLTFGFTALSDGTQDETICQIVHNTAGQSLWLGYEAATQEFVLYSRNTVIVVPRLENRIHMPLEQGEHYTVVISQSATERTLAIRAVQRNMWEVVTEPHAALGNFTRFRLYWNSLV